MTRLFCSATRGELLRQGKDHMEVLHWQQVRQARFEPTGLGQ